MKKLNSTPIAHRAGRSAPFAGIVALSLAATLSWASGDTAPPAGSEAPRPPAKNSDSAAGASITSIDPPAPPGSTSPALAVEPPATLNTQYEFLMTWVAPDKLGGRLMFSRLAGSAWTAPTTIAEPVSPGNGSDQPSLFLIDTRAVRRTIVSRTGDTIARSGDAGQLWSRLPGPTLSFGSFAGGDEGGYAFWLDPVSNDEAKLTGTRLLAGATLLDAHAARGVPTSAAMTWDGPIVVYRDRRPDGTSNVAIVRRVDAKWTEPAIVHADGWRPVADVMAGPRVAVEQRKVAVVWYTETAAKARVLLAFSTDAGKTFGTPVEVDASEGAHAPSGPAAVVVADGGEAVVSWLSKEGPAEAAVNVARMASDGKQGEPLILAKATPSALATWPQMARADDRIGVAWTEGVLRHVRAVSVPLTGIPAPGTRRPRPATAPAAARSQDGHGRVGDPAPEFELASLDGAKVSLTSLRGRPVLVNLWATWCGPCILEMPELAALAERYEKQGVVFLGVNVDDADASSKVRAFVEKHRVPFNVWRDPEMRLPHALRVQGLPATFVLDRAGRIALRRELPIKADDTQLANVLTGLTRSR